MKTPDFIRFLLVLPWAGAVLAQPDLSGWSAMVSALEESPWVSDLELLEPGSVLDPMQPELMVEGVRERSPWADRLIAELEALPLAEHHADRALDRLLGDGMLRFRLVQAASDRHRPAMESTLTEADLPVEWAVLPMVLTGWDAAYYGPGRRAGAWAMDLPTALSLGLDIRRGWDERHVPERMAQAVCLRIAQVRGQHPDSPLRQVLSLVRGGNAGTSFDADALDADLLGWLHLLRVLLQVDRNFRRDRLHALWALRERDWVPFPCEGEAPLYFSHHRTTGWDLRALRSENPWYTTDSIGRTASRPSVRVRREWLTASDSAASHWCGAPAPSTSESVWEYSVRPGDVLGTIARRTGLRIEDIRRWNRIEGDLIRVGQTLSLRGGLPPETSLPATPAASDEATPWTWHTVEAGESYWSIARDHPGVDLADLLDLNAVAPEDLRPGMRIRIPLP